MNLINLFFENKGSKQTILKNSFWLILSEFFTKGISFLVFVWLARHFGVEVYGQWVFALSFVMVFSILADFGFGTLTIREVARDKSKSVQYIDNILAMKLILGLATIVLTAVTIQFLGKEAEVVKLVYILSFYVIIDTFNVFFQSIFRANEKMQYVTFCRIIQGLSLVGLIAFFILIEGSIFTISYAYVLATLIEILFCLIFIWRYFSRFFLKVNLEVCKEIIKKVQPFFLSSVFFVIYFKINSIMLGIFSTIEEVSYYNIAFNLYAAVFILPEIISASFFPRLSYFYKRDNPELKKTFKNFKLILGVITLPLGLVLFLFSGPLISIIYPEEFSNSIIILKIFSLIILFRFLTYAYGWFLTSADEQGRKVKIMGFCALLNIILNYFLIIKYNALGAVIATFITELVLLALYYIYSKRKLRIIYEKEYTSSY